MIHRLPFEVIYLPILNDKNITGTFVSVRLIEENNDVARICKKKVICTDLNFISWQKDRSSRLSIITSTSWQSLVFIWIAWTTLPRIRTYLDRGEIEKSTPFLYSNLQMKTAIIKTNKGVNSVRRSRSRPTAVDGRPGGDHS